MMQKKYIKVVQNLKKINSVSVATTNNKIIDNAVVNVVYLEDKNEFYFGSYSYTTKIKNIKLNSLTALTYKNYQIHGVIEKIEKGGEEFKNIHKEYHKKYPKFSDMILDDDNDYYRIKILVVWEYNVYNNMKRDVYIFNKKYYNLLDPYDRGDIT